MPRFVMVIVKVTLLPVNAGFGEASFETDRSAVATTVALAEAVLLSETGSVTTEATLAVLTIRPGEVELTVIVTVALALLERLPTAHVTTPFV